MTRNDAYYRALLTYRSIVDNKRDCVRDRCSFADADGTETIRVKRINCTIDNEWIEQIENGLIYIEKAIKEDRQFIYSNGEVLPIEKVKNVSKESVVHLARHSDLITRETPGEDLIPDKLYSVERISDYTVYENKFLYMLLCYLRDFVSLRYTKILDLTNAYSGALSVEKQISTVHRNYRFKLDLTDEMRDDDYLKEHNPAKELIDRLDLILKAITSLLNTPLMEIVSKVPRLKPPITKTNVLKMDNNFKEAMHLYEYIIAYQGDGYQLEESITQISPFQNALAEDFAAIGQLIAFVVYQYGLNIQDELRTAYELEEAQRRSQELKQRAEQITVIRRRLDRNEIPAEEYIYELEKQMRAMQNELDRAATLPEQIDELKEIERKLTEQVDTLTLLCAAFEDEKARIIAEHEEAMRQLRQAHREEIALIDEQHKAEIAELQEAHKTELEMLRTHMNARIAALETTVSELTAKSEQLTEENAAIMEENNCLSARVFALRFDKDDISDAEKQALTEQADFERLEDELASFVRFYRREWTKAKRKIRKDLINFKYIKGKNDAE